MSEKLDEAAASCSIKPGVEKVSPHRLAFEEAATVRKRGRKVMLRREVEAMSYAQRHTSIPIPSVMQVLLDDASADKDESWILMERLPGRRLDAAWPDMTDEARAVTLQHLRSYLKQLHHLKPSSSTITSSSGSTHGKEEEEECWIGSVSRGPAYDHRLSSRFTVGPFASVAEFHDFLVAPVKQCPRPEWVAKYRGQLSDHYQVHFAHADLSWENILVDASTGDVTGILDWEMAGFWPEWWEYRKALFGGRTGESWWVGIVSSVMKAYPSETDTDMDLEMF